jgi:uncharacterized protein (TIGR00369 family)
VTDNARDNSTDPAEIDPFAADWADLGTLNAIGLGTLHERMGIVFTEISAERAVATMPVEGNTQPYGLLHGGASVVLAESVGSVLAVVAAGPGRAAVGVDISATHHRAMRSGIVTAVGTPLHVGRTTASIDIVLYDEAGRRVCTSRLTAQIRNAPPSTPTPAPSPEQSPQQSPSPTD